MASRSAGVLARRTFAITSSTTSKHIGRGPIGILSLRSRRSVYLPRFRVSTLRVPARCVPSRSPIGVAAGFVLAAGVGGTLLAAQVFKLSPPVIGDAAAGILWPWYVPIGMPITIPCALALGAIPRLWRRGAAP